MLKLKPVKTCDDPAGDNKAGKKMPDIKKLWVFTEKKYLYLAADYYNNIALYPDIFHTFHIQVPGKEKMNYWVQWNHNGLIWVARFKDGTPFDKWTTLDKKGGFEMGLEKTGTWKIPLSLFREGLSLKICYIAGGYDKDGKQKWDADRTEWLEIKK